MVLVARDGVYGAPTATLSYGLGAEQVVNAIFALQGKPLSPAERISHTEFGRTTRRKETT